MFGRGTLGFAGGTRSVADRCSPAKRSAMTVAAGSTRRKLPQLSRLWCPSACAARALVIVGSAANCRRQSARTTGPTPSATAAASSITCLTAHSWALRIGSKGARHVSCHAFANAADPDVSGFGHGTESTCSTDHFGYVSVFPRRFSRSNRPGVLFHHAQSPCSYNRPDAVAGIHPNPKVGTSVHNAVNSPLTVLKRVASIRLPLLCSSHFSAIAITRISATRITSAL